MFKGTAGEDFGFGVAGVEFLLARKSDVSKGEDDCSDILFL